MKRRLIAVLRAGEQYTAFLLLWYFFLAVQSVLRTFSLCFALLSAIADWQELAPQNFLLILRLGFYSALCYAVASALLFLVAPGSHIIHGFQEYRQSPSLIAQIKLQYRLWIQLPLRSVLYLLEFILAVIWAVLVAGFQLAYLSMSI